MVERVLGKDEVTGSIPVNGSIPFAIRSIASKLLSTSASVVAHDETLIRIAARPCQTVGPHQHVPSSWIAAITARVVSSSAERHQHLIQHHIVENLVTGLR